MGFLEETAFAGGYDADFQQLWWFERPMSQFWGVASDGVSLVAVGYDASGGDPRPYAAWFGDDGAVTSELVVDPVPPDFDYGRFDGVALGEDGTAYCGGVLSIGGGRTPTKTGYIVAIGR